jgi:hypothetical protein
MKPSADDTSRAPTHRYITIESAAPVLGLTVQALRARCWRAQKKKGKPSATRFALGGGIVAVKFGRTWRVLLP